MMKKRVLSFMIAGVLALTASIPLQGCYGKFALTRMLYNWNGTLGNKWLNSIVLWGLYIIPVYPIAGAADFLVLNTVEFWTGKNPMAMGPFERETRIAFLNGQGYVVTATRNRLDIVPAKGPIVPVSVVFEPDQNTWYVIENGIKRKIAEQEGDAVALIHPDGHREILRR